ncbi:MAG: HAD family phosphatase [archaeon]
MFAVIFDMDGVVFDSVPTLWGGCKEAVAQHGATLTDADLPAYRGLSWKDTVDKFNRDFNLSILFDDFNRFQIQRELMVSRKGNYLVPGLKSLLSMLREHHVPLAIGTSSEFNRAEGLLIQSGVRDFFQAIASANDATHHKPAPDIFLVAAQRLNVDPKNCIVIEDGSSGVEAAHCAGMKAIGFAQDETNRAALAKADLVIRDFSELSYEKLVQLLN